MPPVVAAVAAYFAVSAAMATFIIVATAVTLASVAYSAYMMATMERPSAQADAVKRLQTLRSSVQPHRMIYGEAMTGGVLAYAQSHSVNPLSGITEDGENKYISLVVAFTGHEVDSIKEVWLNDKISSDASFVKHIPAQAEEGYFIYEAEGGGPPTWVVTRPATPARDETYSTIRKYTGTATQTADSFLMSLPPKPTTVISKNPSSGLNDFSVSGDYTVEGMAVFTISIHSVGATDKFNWSDDQGHSGTAVGMTAGNQLLVNGISIKFAAATGHSMGQAWEVRAFDGAPWTAECRLQGRSYVVVTLENNDTAFPNGLPNIKALIRGNNQIYDPRTGTTGYTDNWAMCVRDYLTKSYGLNAPSADINSAVAIAAANICDETVTLANGTTQKRYTLNGSFTVDKTPTAIMNEILATAYGAIAWTQGQYRILPAAYYAPDMTFHGMNAAVPGLTESDLRAPVKVRPRPSMKDRFNTVKGTYISPETWQPVDFPQVTNATYVTEDGGEEIARDVQLSYITDPARAQRVAKIMLEKSRQGITVEFPAKWSAFPLAVGDNVPLTIAYLGWSQKVFTVRDWVMNPGGGVDLTLQEDAASCYSWGSGEESTVDLAQNTILPDARFVAAPSGLSTNVRSYTTNSGTAPRVDLYAVWTAGSNQSVRYQVQYQEASGAWFSLPDTLDTVAIINGLNQGTYNVRVRAVNALGAVSDWATTSQLVPLPVQAVPNVTGFAATFAANLVKLAWTADPLDAYSYEIRQGSTWATATVVRTGERTGVWTFRPTGSGSITYLIKAIDIVGNESATAASATATVPAAAPPTAIAPSGVIGGIDLAVTCPATSDIDYCEVWASTANNRDVEGTTNLFASPLDFSQSAWSKRAGTVLNGGAFTAPDGSSTAAQFTQSSGDGYIYQTRTHAANTTYTETVWAKGVSGAMTLQLKAWDGTVPVYSGPVISLTTSWQQYTHTFTTDAVASFGDFGFFVQGVVQLWHPQFEAKPYATPFVNGTRPDPVTALVGITRDGRFLHNGLPNAATRYYWARTRNVFGDYSAWYPASATAGVLGASLADPSQLITLLNSQVDSTALTDYLAGKGSFSDLVDTATPAALAGVGQTGVFATKGQMLIQADRQLQLKAGSEDVNTQVTLLDSKIQLKASSADVSAQVDILSTAIGLKLNATGTVGAGMLISAPSGGKSTIQFWSDCLQVCMPDGTGVKPLLTTGLVGGTPSIGIAGNMFIDGSVSASKIAVGELIVGTNVTMGPSATIAWSNVTSAPGNLAALDFTASTKLAGIAAGATVGADWNTNVANKPTIPTVPSYITSTKITATTIESPTISAGNITGSTITGGTIQTSTAAHKIVLSETNNELRFCDNGGNTQILMWCFNGSSSSGNLMEIGSSTWVNKAIAATASNDNNATVDIRNVSTSGLGKAVYADGGSGYGIECAGGKTPLRLVPSASSSAPTHTASAGSLWVTSAGVLYITTIAGTWVKVGAQ